MTVFIPDTKNVDLNLALEQLANGVITTVTNTVGSNSVTVSGNAIITPGGEIVGYLNRYMWVTYASDGYGSNASPSDTNKSYYGILNSNDNANQPNNFLTFSYTQIAGGFGTNSNLYYKTTGGRNIQWDVNTAPQSSEWLVVPNTPTTYVPIDLDTITAITGGSNGVSTFASVIYQANTTQPSAPTGGTYTFSTNTLVPPSGWFANIPTITTQNIYAATYTFTTSNADATITAASWNASNAVYSLGKSATSTYNFPVYIRQGTVPNTPVANTGYYDFGTMMGGVPTGNPSTEIWNIAPPTGSDILYVSYATASSVAQGNANMLTWSAPVQAGSTGANGANGATSIVGIVYQANSSPPLAISTSGYYNFATNILYAPSGWSNSIPAGDGLPIWASQATFSSNSNGNVANLTSWTNPVLAFQAGGAGPAGTRGFIPLAFVLTNSDPTTYSNAQYTSAFSSSRTNTNPPIGTGYVPIAGDTAQFYYANNANRQNDVAVVRSFDGSGWSNAVGQVIGGNLIVTGSINSAQLNTNSLYAIKIRGGSVQNVTDTANVGYFLDAPSGDALFTGNVRVGDKLSVGNNALFGNSLVIGANSFVGLNANIGANLNVGANATIGNNLRIGSNLFVGQNANIGANLNVQGLVTTGNLNANTVATTNIIPDSVNTITFAQSDAINTFQNSPVLNTRYLIPPLSAFDLFLSNSSALLTVDTTLQFNCRATSTATFPAITYRYELIRAQGGITTVLASQSQEAGNVLTTGTFSLTSIYQLINSVDSTVSILGGGATYSLNVTLLSVKPGITVNSITAFNQRSITVQQVKR